MTGIWFQSIRVDADVQMTCHMVTCFRNVAAMHFAVTVRRRQEGCVPSARRGTRLLKRHPWAVSISVPMLGAGMRCEMLQVTCERHGLGLDMITVGVVGVTYLNVTWRPTGCIDILRIKDLARVLSLLTSQLHPHNPRCQDSHCHRSFRQECYQ